MKIIFIIFLFPLAVFAQTNTNKAINKGEADLKALKGLFSKHKKDSTSQKKNDSQATNQQASSNEETAPDFKGNNIYVAGKQIPGGAKIIDCDYMYPFNLGAAIITKGRSYALIDSAGNFIAPWNKYTDIIPSNLKTGNTGIFKASGKPSENYYVNSNGKIIYDIFANMSSYQDRLTDDGKFIILTPIAGKTPGEKLVIDKNGKKYHIPGDGDLSDSIYTFYKENNGNRFYGFNKLDNTTILKPTFSSLTNFYDGVAVFGMKDQFGQFKYGLVNKKGKIILPPTFLDAPIINGNDIATVFGTASSDYYKELINLQSGKVIFKTVKRNDKEFKPCDNSTYSVAADQTGDLLDSSGNIMTVSDFLKPAGVRIGVGQKYMAAYVFSVHNLLQGSGLLIFSLIPSNRNNDPYMKCVYNIKSATFIFGDFQEEKAPLIVDFDPVSHLSFSSLPTGKKDNYGTEIHQMGYMNGKGEFAIIRGQGQ